jgi:uncharacterized protein
VTLGTFCIGEGPPSPSDPPADSWIGTASQVDSALLIVVVTEEGFFRGWLWASLECAGLSCLKVVIASSVAFALWRLSAVTLETGFHLPAAQIPVYMINAAVMGVIWGLLRRLSGSVFVASVSHGLWNGGAYTFIGFGSRVGALGIQDTTMYAPGLLGLALNVLFAATLWWCVVRRGEARFSSDLRLQ